MDTTERMMIMGMCLQGLLANPDRAPLHRGKADDPEFQAEIDKHIEANIKLAHRYADRLDPPPKVTSAQVIALLTRVAYEAVRAADADGAGKWKPWAEASTSLAEADADNVDGVFERVSRWFNDPTGYPETTQDRIIAAIVAANAAGAPDQ